MVGRIGFGRAFFEFSSSAKNTLGFECGYINKTTDVILSRLMIAFGAKYGSLLVVETRVNYIMGEKEHLTAKLLTNYLRL